jgi:nucleotide-binding universal stress UspA family protein
MPDATTAPIRLVLAYDGSESADAAIRAAAQLLPGAQATVVYARESPALLDHAALARVAVPDAVLLEGARAYEREAAERAAGVAERGQRLAAESGFDAGVEVRVGGSPWRGLSRAAHDAGADLIVCGSRGQGQLSRTFLGSTSSALVHNADRPVLVIPPKVAELGGPSLIGYDGSDGARLAIAAAARILTGRPAIVAHAWSSPLDRSYARAAVAAVPLTDAAELKRNVDVLFADYARELAEEGGAIARDEGLEANGIAVEIHDGAWRTLAATARDEGAAVIVAGSRGRGAIGSAILGSVSAGLVHNAELPVLIARGQAA